MKLTYRYLSSQLDGDPKEIKQIKLSGHEITEVEDLSSCQSLARLDLSKNQIPSIRGLSSCVDLTWLNVSRNQLGSLEGTSALKKLAVLNAAHNQITEYHAESPALRALVLNDNALRETPSLRLSPALRTLVLSRNRLASLDIARLAFATGLSKLSLSGNNLRSLPDLTTLPNLSELRVNGNRIVALPSSLSLCARLRILDLGNNRLTDLDAALSSLDPIASGLKWLSLRGNPMCADEGYPKRARERIPALQVSKSDEIGAAGKDRGAVPEPRAVGQDEEQKVLKRKAVAEPGEARSVKKARGDKEKKSKKSKKEKKAKKDKKSKKEKKKKKKKKQEMKDIAEAESPAVDVAKETVVVARRVKKEADSNKGDAGPIKPKKKKKKKVSKVSSKADVGSSNGELGLDDGVDFSAYAAETKAKLAATARSGQVRVKLYNKKKRRVDATGGQSIEDLLSAPPDNGLGLGGSSAW